MRLLALALLAGCATGCTTADHAIDDVKGRLCVFSNPTHDSLDVLRSRAFETWPIEIPQTYGSGDPLALRIQVDDERFVNSGTCTPIVEASCEVDSSSLDASILAVRSRLEWNDYDGPCTREAYFLTIACTTRALDPETYALAYRGERLSIEVPSTRDSAPCLGDDRGY